MAPRPPFVARQTNTNLPLLDELQFRSWLKKTGAPFDTEAPDTDYDMRGYWRGLQQGNPMATPSAVNQFDGQPHFTDYYKTPMHQTFSAESQWAGPDAPQWINDSQLASPGGRILYDEAKPQIGGILGLK